MNLEPLYDRIIVRREEAKEVSEGGIIIPKGAGEPPQSGLVLAVGHGRLQGDGSIKPLSVKPGDRVIFAKYSGASIEYEGQTLLVMREDDLFAITKRG